MLLLPPGHQQPPAEAQFRRLLTRAEAETLLGMLLTVFSLFLAWRREDLSMLLRGVPLSGAVYTNGLTHSGFAYAAIWWPLTIGATICGAALLWTPRRTTRLQIATVQGACGLACLMIALTHFALLPGVLTAIVGSVLLLFGAIDRYLAPGTEGEAR